MKKSSIYIIVIIALIAIGAYFIFAKSTTNGIQNGAGTTTTKEESKEAPKEEKVSIANPASTNCKDKGGNLVIQKDKDGGQYGLCFFDDNRACEEWAMLRGECPVGGVKTTGYDTIDQKYCAWRGGVTKAEASSTCLFKNGNKCLTVDFYEGTCGPND